MYGLPKIHKENIPRRPILSMVRSAQHELAKSLGEVLQPVLDSLSHFVVKDFFTFAESIRAKTPTSEDNIMASLDIKILFTNVPLTETIEICAHLLYHTDITPHIFYQFFICKNICPQRAWASTNGLEYTFCFTWKKILVAKFSSYLSRL